MEDLIAMSNARAFVFSASFVVLLATVAPAATANPGVVSSNAVSGDLSNSVETATQTDGEPTVERFSTEPATPAREAEAAALAQGGSGFDRLSTPPDGALELYEQCNEIWCISIRTAPTSPDPMLARGSLVATGATNGSESAGASDAAAASDDNLDPVDGFNSNAVGPPPTTERLGPVTSPRGFEFPSVCLDSNQTTSYEDVDIVLTRRIACYFRNIEVGVPPVWWTP